MLGLQYLHSTTRTVHRDIKCGNILLTDKGHVKLADFGVSASIGGTLNKRKTVVGSPFWMAPEVIKESCYDGKADVWSLGITLIELAESAPPHANLHPLRAIFIIPQKPPPTLADPDMWSVEMVDFARFCLCKSVTQRPDSSMLAGHKFVREDVARLRSIHENGGYGGLLTLRSLLDRMKKKVGEVLTTRATSDSDDGKQAFLNNLNSNTANPGDTFDKDVSTFVAGGANVPVGGTGGVPNDAVGWFMEHQDDDRSSRGSSFRDAKENVNEVNSDTRPPPSSPSSRQKVANSQRPEEQSHLSHKMVADQGPSRRQEGLDDSFVSMLKNKVKTGEAAGGAAYNVGDKSVASEPEGRFSNVMALFDDPSMGAVPPSLSSDEFLHNQLRQLLVKLSTEMSSLKISYDLAKKQLIAEAQLRNSLPFDATELMRQAARKSEAKVELK